MAQTGTFWRFLCLCAVFVGAVVCLSPIPASAAAKNARYIPYVTTDGQSGYVDLLHPGKHALPHVSPTVRKKSANGITFNIYFSDVVDKTGIGFDDPNTGADARACVTDVCDYLNTVLVENGVCDVLLRDSFMDTTLGVLASTAEYVLPSGGFDNGFAFHHITTGKSPQPIITDLIVAGDFIQCQPGWMTIDRPDGTSTIADISATVNFAWTWNLVKEPPPADAFDLRSVLLHEFTHALGFSLSVGPDGNPIFTYGMFKFLDFLETGNGKKLWDSTTTAFLGTPEDLLGQDNGIVFTGAAATQSFGSNPHVYAPAVWQPGSSLDHWDIVDLHNTVMKWGTETGDMMRAYAPVDIGALHDLGYNTVDAADWGQPPEAAFTATPSVGTAPLSVAFQDDSIPGAEPITSWFWSFGDGATSEDQDPTHVYNTSGAYTVQLIVRSATRSDIANKTECVIVLDTQKASVADVIGGAWAARDLLPIVIVFAVLALVRTRPSRLK